MSTKWSTELTLFIRPAMIVMDECLEDDILDRMWPNPVCVPLSHCAPEVTSDQAAAVVSASIATLRFADDEQEGAFCVRDVRFNARAQEFVVRVLTVLPEQAFTHAFVSELVSDFHNVAGDTWKADPRCVFEFAREVVVAVGDDGPLAMANIVGELDLRIIDVAVSGAYALGVKRSRENCA